MKGAGHHVYADKAEAFNFLVNRITNQADHTPPGGKNQKQNAMPPSGNQPQPGGSTVTENMDDNLESSEVEPVMIHKEESSSSSSMKKSELNVSKDDVDTNLPTQADSTSCSQSL